LNRPTRRTAPVTSEAAKNLAKQKPALPKLLIADDERHIAEGLQMLLEEEGYSVATATSGTEGRGKRRAAANTDLSWPI
jgi:CheY-like chemotaxis protein